MKEHRINSHGHLLPYPEQIPAFMKEKSLFWLTADRKFMRQNDWSRPITDPSFFLEEKLIWMGQNNIDHEIVLNLSQLYCNGLDQSTTNDICTFQNDYNASIQHDYPTKFTGGFVVNPRYIDDALREIERCVNHNEQSLLCLPTHFLNQDEKWTTIADKSVQPIFELANSLNLALEIHPYDGEKIIALQNSYWRFHLIWMCAQTADAYHFYTLNNYHEIYPNLRVSFAHGNQFGQMGHGRRKQGFLGRPDLFEGASNPDNALKKPNLFFDTLVHDPYALRLMKDRQSSTQIIAGLDDPYPLGEMESVEDSYPGKVIDDAHKLGFISDTEKRDIWHKNVINWIAGPNKNKFLERTKLL